MNKLYKSVLCHLINRLTEAELPEILRAIEKRYATAYPAWDAYYIALHKDPQLRKQEITEIRSFAAIHNGEAE